MTTKIKNIGEINGKAKYVNCNLCNENDFKVLQKDELYKVVRCKACGLVYVNPQPVESTLFENYAQTYYLPWLNNQAAAREKMWKKRLKKMHKYRQEGRLLDVGCACGHFLNAAKKHGWDVYGTEVSSYAADYTKDVFHIEVFKGKLHEACFPKEYFDVITLWHVLEHTEDPFANIKEVKRILKPEGLLIVAVPNIQNYIYKAAYALFKRKKYKYYSSSDREIHLYHFSLKTLKRLIEKSGLITIKQGMDMDRIKLAEKIHDILTFSIFKVTKINMELALEIYAKKA